MPDTMPASQNPTVEENPSPTTEATPPEEVHVWAPPLLIVLRFTIVAFLIVVDLLSKWRVFEWLTENRFNLDIDSHGHSRHLILGEWFTFMKSLNNGAAFGQLSSVPHLLIGGRVIAVVFLSWLVLRAPNTRRVFTTALMLVLAGATGNLWDNLFMEPTGDHPYGAVRDFIDVYFAGFGENGWHFPTFNVADSSITVGAVLLLLSGFGKDESADSGSQADSPLLAERPSNS